MVSIPIGMRFTGIYLHRMHSWMHQSDANMYCVVPWKRNCFFIQIVCHFKSVTCSRLLVCFVILTQHTCNTIQYNTKQSMNMSQRYIFVLCMYLPSNARDFNLIDTILLFLYASASFLFRHCLVAHLRAILCDTFCCCHYVVSFYDKILLVFILLLLLLCPPSPFFLCLSNEQTNDFYCKCLLWCYINPSLILSFYSKCNVNWHEH